VTGARTYGGGVIVATGTPEDAARIAGSYTGRFLAPLLTRRGPEGQRVE